MFPHQEPSVIDTRPHDTRDRSSLRLASWKRADQRAGQNRNQVRRLRHFQDRGRGDAFSSGPSGTVRPRSLCAPGYRGWMRVGRGVRTVDRRAWGANCGSWGHWGEFVDLPTTELQFGTAQHNTAGYSPGRKDLQTLARSCRCAANSAPCRNVPSETWRKRGTGWYACSSNRRGSTARSNLGWTRIPRRICRSATDDLPGRFFVRDNGVCRGRGIRVGVPIRGGFKPTLRGGQRSFRRTRLKSCSCKTHRTGDRNSAR